MLSGKSNIIFVIGVSGVGKSTIGTMLAHDLSIPFFDGDDFHSKANVSKMSNGVALNDKDREGWLHSINQLAKKEEESKGCVIACSALKKKYREILSKEINGEIKWVFLNGTFEQIKKRLENRGNHFMSSALLQSQFDTLEIPDDAISVDIDLKPEEITNIVKDKIHMSEFGLLGLGVMGKSLSRNLAQKGFSLSLFNRHVDEKEVDVAVNFIAEHNEFKTAKAFDNLEKFVNSIDRPRKIMLMVNAGKTTDIVIEELIPFLSEGDILIDGGNSHFDDTKARSSYLKDRNIEFVGSGVSGGEEGALKGPSIMPGGNKTTYELIRPYLEAIAAKDNNGLPCCTYIGPDGSGHFVKMVHNGIEYAEMQLLAEVVSVFKSQNKTYDEIAEIMESWEINASYLQEITISILRKKEGDDWLLDKILDKAGNKGTGNWTTVASAQLGIPSTLITSSLFARYTSFLKKDRVAASSIYADEKSGISISTEELMKAYHFARIVNHCQGFNLISEKSKKEQWDLNLSEIARIWTNGCIIRSKLMEEFIETLKENENSFFNTHVVDKLKETRSAISALVSQSVLAGVSIPCFSEAINFLNAYSESNSMAKLIQAQRDFFGAHTYQRIDDPTDTFHHTIW